MTASDRQSAFSGTREVAERLRFDTARLEGCLSERLPDFAGPIAVSQFKGGQSNPTYLIDTPRRRYVLRRKPPGKLLPSAHAVDREYKVIEALYAEQFPVAEPLLYCADESIVGEWLAMWDEVLREDAAATDRQQVGYRCGQISAGRLMLNSEHNLQAFMRRTYEALTS